MPKTKAIIDIQNVVVSVTLNQKIDLNAVVKGYSGVEYRRARIIIISKPEMKTQNIVASVSLGGRVDLEQAVVKLVKTMYEPEQFPGLIYRMDEPKVVILLFASGKLVCTGAKKEQDVYDAVHKLHASLEEQNLIYYE